MPLNGVNRFSCIYLNGITIFIKFLQINSLLIENKDAGVNFKTNIQCAIHTMEKKAKSNFSLEDTSIVHYLKSNQPRKYAEELSKYFHYSNGSCYYLPPYQSRKTWLESKTYCENIGTNRYSSLYAFTDSKQLEYELVIRMLENYYEKSKARADVSFNIGLKYSNHSMLNSQILLLNIFY